MKIVEEYRPHVERMGFTDLDHLASHLRAAAMRSGCRKSQRGAILVSLRHRVEFRGWNRPAVGECDDSATCRADCARICVHAEEDALINAGDAAHGGEMFHLHVVDGVAVASGQPSCVECSKLMLAAGVAGMWLYQADGWRRWTAEEFHRATLRNLALHGG